MAIKTQGIGKQLRAIITSKTKEIFDSYKTKYVRRLDKIGKAWQKSIREKIGIKSDGKINLTEWPKRRTGGLQRSVNSPHVSGVTTRARGFYYEASIKFTPMFKKYQGNRKNWKWLKDPSKPTKASVNGDIGDLLNNWEGKPFAGWKTRAVFMFKYAIEQAKYRRMSLGGKAGQEETRQYFVRNMTKEAESRMYMELN